ncbi:hypothetical protein GH714_031567 [Hevea brasiliensis]|uniref:Uncharacterized protein n=1 Tax=Hevea brasiliensis TaxID=3981 RepID=A0A6A6LFI8_HEVBR|nr:hypothetical protein GH714_031567 [Hevea brasiliensis]
MEVKMNAKGGSDRIRRRWLVAVVSFLHSFQKSSCLEWRCSYPLLEEAGLEAWAVDVLGWGFSDLEMRPPCDVASKRYHLYQLWKSYIKRPMILVGPSLGASVAMDFTVNYPEAVEKLILINPNAYAEGTRRLAKLPPVIAYAGVSLLKSIPLRLYANALAFNGTSFYTILDWTNVGRLHCMLPWWKDATVSFMSSGGYNVGSLIKQVKQRTLIICGENDQIVNYKLAVKLHCELPNAIMRQVADSGHLPHVDKPNCAANLIAVFAIRELEIMEGDAEERQIQARFVTKLKPQFKAPPTAITIPANLTRLGLSTIVNSLLKAGNPDWENEPFDFLIDGELVRMSLEQFLLAKGISAEKILEIEYIKQWSLGDRRSLLCMMTGSVQLMVLVLGEDSVTVATGSKDQTLRLWKFHTEEPEKSPAKIRAFKILRGHNASVQSVAAETSGSMICSGSWDCTINLWRTNESETEGDLVSVKKRKVKNKAEESQLEGEAMSTLVGHTQSVSSVVWPERETMYSASWDHSIRHWDVETGKDSMKIFCGKALNCVHVGGEGSALIAAGGSDPILRIWDPRKQFSSHTSWISGCKWHDKSWFHLLSASYDGKVMLWDLRTAWPLSVIESHEDKVLCADWWKGDSVVSGGVDCKLCISSDIGVLCFQESKLTVGLSFGYVWREDEMPWWWFARGMSLKYLSLSDQFFDTETNVYNLKANTWRKIQGMSYVLGFDQKMGVLQVEDFREVPAPESIGENLSIDLGVVGKWLSLTANYECMRLDVWVMKEYGVEESWTRLFVITPNEVAPLKCLRTLAFSKNGDELLLGVQAGNLVWVCPCFSGTNSYQRGLSWLCRDDSIRGV